MDEKKRFFRTFDFEGFLEGFGQGFWKPKSLIFAIFSTFFRSRFWSAFPKAKKSDPETEKGAESEVFGPALRCTGRAWGGI